MMLHCHPAELCLQCQCPKCQVCVAGDMLTLWLAHQLFYAKIVLASEASQMDHLALPAVLYL